MANATDYLENKLIDHIFRTTTWSQPTQLNVALYTVTPDDTGGGTEVTGGSYARVDLPPLNTNWTGTHGSTTGASSGTGGATDNAVEITFPAPTADWGTVVAFGIFDESSNLLIWGPVTPNKTVNNGDPAPKYAVNDLVVTIG